MSRRGEPSDERQLERRAILQDLFSGKHSAQFAAEELASISLYPEQHLECLWGHLIVLARRFPEQQDKLVELLVCLSQLPPPKDSDGNDMVIYGLHIWRDLPMFGWEVNSEWNGLEVPSEHGPERRRVTIEFVNVNRFVACLTITSVPALSFELFCLWTMRSALEHPASSEDLKPPDVYVPAAATCIFIAGQQMYGWDKEFEQGPRVGAPGRGGPLWTGKHGFCTERWTLWRTRFKEVASMERLGDELKMVAKEAELRMEEIEAAATA